MTTTEDSARRMVSDRLALYGYTPEQITEGMRPRVHDNAGCNFEGVPGACYDENGDPGHPLQDEADEAAEFVMWVLEHPELTTTREATV